VPVAGMDLEAPPVQAPQAMDVAEPAPPPVALPVAPPPVAQAPVAQAPVAQAPVAQAPSPQAMDVAAPAPPPVAPPPVAQAPSPAVVAPTPPPAVVAPTPPRAPPDIAWDLDSKVYSVEAKFASRLKHFIQIGHYLEDGPNLTFLDRMDEVHGLVVVVETTDEKFALVGATPKIAAAIRSGKFWAATRGEDLFFATVESDARRLT